MFKRKEVEELIKYWEGRYLPHLEAILSKNKSGWCAGDKVRYTGNGCVAHFLSDVVCGYCDLRDDYEHPNVVFKG